MVWIGLVVLVDSILRSGTGIGFVVVLGFGAGLEEVVTFLGVRWRGLEGFGGVVLAVVGIGFSVAPGMPPL